MSRHRKQEEKINVTMESHFMSKFYFIKGGHNVEVAQLGTFFISQVCSTKWIKEVACLSIEGKV